MLTILRYFLTGHCGNLCAHEPFTSLEGDRITLWVPEAGCPVHDPERWWLVAASFLVRLLRGICITFWDEGVPVTYDEDVREAVRGG